VKAWHVDGPTELHTSRAAGPYDRWPLGAASSVLRLFLGVKTHHGSRLVYDNHEVEQPKLPEEGYHLSRTGRQAIEFIQARRSTHRTSLSSIVNATGAGPRPAPRAQEWADK